MIRIFLTPPEFRHYSDLVAPPAVFRDTDHDSPVGQRSIRVKALESVIGMDRPRDLIGADEFEVYGSRTEKMARWA